MPETAIDQDTVERARLACLRSLQILDTAADERLDRITRIAAQHFDVPIALVSLIDEDRQWFKSKVGLEAFETPRCDAFCDYAIRGSKVFVINDSLTDERFKDAKLVQGPPNIRFYAGAPITIDKAHTIGTLCIIDDKPRDFRQDGIDKLASLAHSVQILIEGLKRSRNVLDQVQSASNEPRAAQ